MLTISIIKNEIEPIAREYGVKKVYVFGSYAKGCVTEDSDVDLLVEKAPHMSAVTLAAFWNRIIKALKCNVDLLLTTGINKKFDESIGENRVLIYEG